MKEYNKWGVDEKARLSYAWLTLNMKSPKRSGLESFELVEVRKKPEVQKKPRTPKINLGDYITAKHVMYDVLERYHQINPVQIGIVNFLIEQEHERLGADLYELEDMRSGFGQEEKLQLTSSDFGTAIIVFESLPKNQGLSESDSWVIRKALESRKAASNAPIKVKPAPSIGSVRKEPSLFKRRTKSTGPKA